MVAFHEEMALRKPAFRKLWGAAAISGTCVVARDNAATWMMNVFTGFALNPLVDVDRGRLFLGRWLSINLGGDLEERLSGVPLCVSNQKRRRQWHSKRIARSPNDSEKNYEQQTSRKWGADRSADFHFTCL
jgi:hypothetical protein